jgi:hypothetical protein
MTWTAAADAVVPGCARAAAACPPASDILPRQREPGCVRRLHLLVADLVIPGWPSDPGREVP